MSRTLASTAAGPVRGAGERWWAPAGLLAAGMAATLVVGGGWVLLALVAAAILGAIVWHVPEATLVAFAVAGPVGSSNWGASLPVNPVAATAVLLLAAVVATAVRRRHDPVRVPRSAAAFAALAAVLAAAAVYAPDPAAGLHKFAMFAGLSALAFGAPLVLIRGRTSMVRLGLAFVAAGLLVAAFSVRTDHASRPVVLPGSTSEIDVGLLTGIGLLAIVAYLWPLTPARLRPVWLVPGGYLAVTAVSAGSRGALAGVIAAVIVSILLQIAFLPSARRAALGLLAVAVVAAPFVIAASPEQARQKYLATLQGEGGLERLDAAGGDRAQITSAAVDLFTTNPLGVGTAGYPALTGFQWPHNIVLELGTELGVIGIGLYVVLIGGALRGIAHALGRRASAPEAVGAMGFLAVPFVLSFSSFDLNGNRLLWLTLGVAFSVAALAPRTSGYAPPDVMGSRALARLVSRRSFVPPSIRAGGIEALLVRGLEAGLAVTLVILTARLLEPGGRGLFALASLTATLCSLPLGSVWSAAAMELAHRRSTLGELLGACSAIAIVGGLATAAVAIALVPFLGDRWWVVALPAAVAPAILLARYQEGLFQAIGHVRAVNMVTIARVGVPLTFIGVALGAGAADRPAIMAWVAGLAVLPILFWAPLHRLAGAATLPRSRALYRRLLGAGGKLVLANSALLLNTRIALIVIAIFSTAAAVGVYSVAIAAGEVLYLTTYAMVSGAFYRIGSGRRGVSADLTSRAARHVVLLTAAGGTLLVPAVFLFLDDIVGPGYHDVPWLLLILLPGVLAFAVWWVVQTYFVVQRESPGAALRISGAGLATTAVLTFAFVPWLGLWGAAVANVAGNLTTATIGIRRFLREPDVPARPLLPRRDDLRIYMELLLKPRKGDTS